MGMIELQIAPPAHGPLSYSTFATGNFLPDLLPAEPPLRFRGFVLYPRERMLTLDGAPVKLGSRAFDLLTKLAASGGKIVSKSDLVDHVWPSTFVDDSNLRFQMASLRKALGDARDLIKTIPGRGYLFVDNSRSHDAATDRSGLAASTEFPGARLSSPVPLTRNPVDGKGRRFTVLVLEGDGSLRELLGDVLQSLDRDAHPPREAAGMPDDHH